jgi:hypothetical protein
MHNFGFALDGAWRVLVAGLVLGAGLPAVFALGVRAMAYGTGGADGAAAPRPLGRVLGYTCFALVVLAALMGITFIVASGLGKTLNFEHIYPTIVDK